MNIEFLAYTHGIPDIQFVPRCQLNNNIGQLVGTSSANIARVSTDIEYIQRMFQLKNLENLKKVPM